MLEIRPSCEHCDKDLPFDAKDAMICTFECTFCANCVENVLKEVCPNCEGISLPDLFDRKNYWTRIQFQKKEFTHPSMLRDIYKG